MRLPGLFKCVFIITLLALAYIHLQMKIIDLAYQGKSKEQEIRKLIEENGNVTYNILTLKSASHLGGKVMSEDSGMRFVDAEDVVHVSILGKNKSAHRSRTSSRIVKKANAFLNLLSLNSKSKYRH